MARYDKEFKYKVKRMMMPPSNKSVASISKETGISENTLYKWKREAKKEGLVVTDGETNSEKWTSEDKFQIVLETASLNESELSAYCREKGLYVEQIEAWKNACMTANGGLADEAARLSKELRDRDKEYKQVKKELARKESALAETAALLVLRKKMHSIWGENEDE